MMSADLLFIRQVVVIVLSVSNPLRSEAVKVHSVPSLNFCSSVYQCHSPLLT